MKSFGNFKLPPPVAPTDGSCPKCFGTGQEIVEGKGVVGPCDCKRDEATAKRLAEARIPARYSEASFDNFEIRTPNLQRAKLAARQFADNYPNVESGLLLTGNPGVGKTHLACAVLSELIRAGASGLFYDFRDLLQEIRDSYNPNTKASELSILRPVFDVEILVLDELGSERPTEWVKDTMTQIINRRYVDRKVTIFTTNYLDVAARVSDETLTERIGVRFRSRLHEMCRAVLVEADDYREVINKRRGARLR